MRREDWVNWTPDHCKRKIHEYQRTKNEKTFDLLLAKYDKYLVSLAWDFKSRVQNIDLEDLYHSAVLGFGTAISRFKTQAPSSLIIAVIKAYVKEELEQKFTRNR